MTAEEIAAQVERLMELAGIAGRCELTFRSERAVVAQFVRSDGRRAPLYFGVHAANPLQARDFAGRAARLFLRGFAFVGDDDRRQS